MNLLFTFSDNSQMTSDFLTDGAKITECYYKELKYADNSASVKVPFNETLCDKLKADISKNIKVQIKDGSNVLFTGYARKTMGFSKTQRNQPFSLEILTPNILLDVNYKGTAIHYINVSVAQIISNLLSLTSYLGTIDSTALNGESCLIFTLSDGDNIATTLQDMLFEYGYTYDFDANGNIKILSVFNIPSNTITQAFNGDNCLNEIQQTVKEDAFKQTSVKWSKVARRTNILIFEDTTGADENHKANIQIDANGYYLGEEHNYCEYDSKFQSIVWITDASTEISYADSSKISQTFQNLGTKGDLSIRNNSQSANTIYGLQIYGDGYFEISTNESKVGQSGTCKEVSTKYIQSDVYASRLARKLADYYNYANFTIQITSKTDYDIGSFCTISDDGLGTIKCRIIKKVWNIKLNNYNYTLESISEYSPAEIYQSYSSTNSKSDNGESLRDAVQSLKDEVDNLNIHTTMCTADILSVILKLDADKKTITTTDITTTIFLKRDDELLPFSIGTINLPEGWTYTIVDGKIKFHVGAGVKINAGRFTIPVQYRVVIGQEYYEDENGNQYLDENDEPYIEQIMSGSYTQWNLYFQYFGDQGGAYFGPCGTLDSIPTNCDYDDYFTWTGTNHTASTLSQTREFLQGRVYHYVGNTLGWSWEQDTNADHNFNASSDVYALANADLQANNSTLYQYLDHLTSNSIYTDMLVANQGFIQRLSSEIITADVAKVSDLESGTIVVKTAQHSSTSDKATKSDSATTSTTSGTATNLSGGYMNAVKTESAKGQELAISTDDFVSSGYTKGFGIYKNGNAYFNNGAFRGDISGASGTFTGGINASSVSINLPNVGDVVFATKRIYSSSSREPVPSSGDIYPEEFTITSLIPCKIKVTANSGFYLRTNNGNHEWKTAGTYTLDFSTYSRYTFTNQSGNGKSNIDCTLTFKSNAPSGSVMYYLLQASMGLSYFFYDDDE